MSTSSINDFAVSSLDDPNKYVQVAAIYAVHAIGSDAWRRALPKVSKLAVDQSQDQEVRSVAERELRRSPVTGPQ